MRSRVLVLLSKCTNRKAALNGFQAITDAATREQMPHNPKVGALCEVIASLSNKELEYLNLLQSERRLEQKQSILSNKLVNRRGVQLDPIQYLYQREWIKTHWKESNLLHFGLSAENEEEGDKEEVVAVRDSFDVELTAIDVAQKIKIIKTLRETFGLGLKEAKEFADKVPSMLKKNVKKEEAEKLKKTLDAAGCVITLK